MDTNTINLPAGFEVETPVASGPVLPDGFEIETGPEPQYGSLMFDTPATPPTAETPNTLIWQDRNNPNALRAIGKTAQNQIVSQSTPIPELPDGFEVETPDVAPQSTIPAPGGTQIPPKAVSPEEQAALPSSVGVFGKEMAKGAGGAVLTTGAGLASMLRGILQTVVQPFARAETGYLPGPPMAQGLPAIPAKGEGPGIMTEFDKELQKPIEAEKFVMERNQKSIEDTLQQAGIGASIAQEIGQNVFSEFYQTALTLGLAEIGKAKKAQEVLKKVPGFFKAAGQALKETAPEAAKFSAFTYATTPGTEEEKIKAAGHSAALILAPAVTAGFPTALTAKIASFAVLTGVTTIPGWEETKKQAQEWADRTGGTFEQGLALKLTPGIMMNLLFGASAHSIPAATRKQLIAEARVANADLVAKMELYQQQQKAQGLLDKKSDRFEGFLADVPQGTPEKPVKMEVVEGKLPPAGVELGQKEGAAPVTTESVQAEIDQAMAKSQKGGGVEGEIKSEITTGEQPSPVEPTPGEGPSGPAKVETIRKPQRGYSVEKINDKWRVVQTTGRGKNKVVKVLKGEYKGEGSAEKALLRRFGRDVEVQPEDGTAVVTAQGRTENEARDLVELNKTDLENFSVEVSAVADSDVKTGRMGKTIDRGGGKAMEVTEGTAIGQKFVEEFEGWTGTEAGQLRAGLDALKKGERPAKEQWQAIEKALESLRKKQPVTVEENLQTMRESPDKEIPLENIPDGALILRNGEWQKVKKEDMPFTKNVELKDGETENLEDIDTVKTKGWISPADPLYKNALKEFEAQEAKRKESTPVEKPVTKVEETKVEKNAPPSRSRNIGRGMKGSVRVEFPSEAEAKLFSWWSRVKQSLGGKNQRPYASDADKEYIKKQLGITTDEEFDRLIVDYPESVKKEIADLAEGETYRAKAAKTTKETSDLTAWKEKNKVKPTVTQPELIKDDSFKLEQEKVVDTERIAREKEAAEKAKVEAEKKQPDLFKGESKTVRVGDQTIELKKDGKVVMTMEDGKSIELNPANPKHKKLIDKITPNTPEVTKQVKANLEEKAKKLKGAKVVVVEDASEFPEGLESMSGGMREAVYVAEDGTSYIDASRVRPGQEARVIAHEAVIHGGLRSLMSEADLTKVLENTYLNGPEHNIAIRKKMLSRNIGRVEAIEEVIADIWSQKEVKPTLWKRLVASLKNGLRKAGFDLEWSENDIDNLIARAKKRVTEGETKKGEKVKRFSETDDLEKLMREIADEAASKDKATIGISNAKMRDRLLALGREDVPQPERKADEAVVDEAIAQMRNDPDLANNLVMDLNEGKRTVIEDWEHAVLDAKAVELENRFNTVKDEILEAETGGEINKVDMRMKEIRAASIEEQITRLAIAAKNAGTATARSLRFRQRMFSQNFTLEALQIRKRAANSGRPLTDKQRERLKVLSERDKRLTKEVEELNKALTEEKRKGFSPEQNDSILSSIRNLLAGRKVRFSTEAKALVKERIPSARERLIAKGLITGKDITRKSEEGAGLSKEDINDIVELGAEKLIVNDNLDPTVWDRKMREDFGNKIDARLKELYQRSLERAIEIRDEAKAKVVKPEPEKKAPVTREQKNIDIQERIIDRQIAEWKKKIADLKAGTYQPKTKVKKPLVTERRLQLKIEERTKLREEFKKELQRDKRNGQDWIEAMNEYLKEKKTTLSNEARADIEKAFRDAAKIEDQASREKAIRDAVDKLGAQVALKKGDWFDAYVYSNMLSSPISQARNILGNWINVTFTKPASLIFKGKFREAGKFLFDSYKTVFNGDAWRAAVEAYRSGEEGKMVESIRDLADDAPEIKKMQDVFARAKRIRGPENKAGRFIWRKVTAVGRFMNAADTYFGFMIETGETARRVSNGESLESATAKAKELANKYLYRDKMQTKIDTSLDPMSKAIEWIGSSVLDPLRNTPGIGKPIKLLGIPFLKTPVKIAQFNVEMTPLGFIGANRNRIAKARYKGESFDEMQKKWEAEMEKPSPDMEEVNRLEKQISEVEDISGERYGRAVAGQFLMVLGALAAATGNTTWAAPKDEKAKKLYYDAGYKPYSVRIGNRWVPMMYFGPGALAFMLPAAFRDVWSDRPETVNEGAIAKLFKTATSIPFMMLEQLPLEGLSSIYNTISGREDWNIKKIVGRGFLQVVPASGMLRWIRNIVDPVYPKATTVGETIEAAIPGLSQNVKALKDSNGLDAKMSLWDALAPYKIGKVNEQKELEYQNRLKILRIKARVLQMKKKLKK